MYRRQYANQADIFGSVPTGNTRSIESARKSGQTNRGKQARYRNLLTALLLVWGGLFITAACKPAGESSDNTPDINRGGASLQPRETIDAITTGADGLEIRIKVPANHHAYLDSGKSGFLIPVTFLWDELKKQGGIKTTPKLELAPTGVYEKEFEATVLRGAGIYKFSGPRWPRGKTFRVKSQICNDISKVCYKPAIQEIKIQ